MDSLDELKNQCSNLRSAIRSGRIKKDIFNGVADVIERDVEDIYQSAIEEWYDSYSPGFYVRQYSLYSMYRVEKRGFSISWDESEKYSSGSHRANEDVIFQNSFVSGYHGGAPFSDDEVLIPEVPNGFRARPYDGPYNKPWAKIKHPKWKRYASQSDSPLDIVNGKIAERSYDWIDMIHNTVNEELEYYIPALGGN